VLADTLRVIRVMGDVRANKVPMANLLPHALAFHSTASLAFIAHSISFGAARRPQSYAQRA
jgi:hypothetical protein